MRYPPGHKESVRLKILDAASRALRARGIAGVSVPALMQEAGLTHGGFYNHFRDRDELVADAIRHAGNRTARTVFPEGVSDIARTLHAYLSADHVEQPEGGCVLAALGSEVSHQPPEVREAFASTARGFLAHLEQKLHPDAVDGRLSDDTLRLAATMIGAVLLARLVHHPALAHRILEAAKVTPVPLAAR